MLEYSKCPQCELNEAKRVIEANQALIDGYGSSDQAQLNTLQYYAAGKSIDDTLSIQSDVGITGGRFMVKFRIRCDRCGFEYSFLAEEDIGLK